ncbi:hypothetical protein DNTS_026225 [Danionella cerebrum]|uniref:Uncharacterized protein n=1 Tax=Danionella cerebrum TaxID=2873325 RepID=A0A553NLF2_9TELE|nr:hypothetical protein DNTS_026225 [Danionella translucida]
MSDTDASETAGAQLLPKPLLDGNPNEDDHLLSKDKDKFRMNPFSYIKKKKRTAPAPPKRSCSFGKTDVHMDRRGPSPDSRDDFSNGASFPNDSIDHLKLQASNSASNGAQSYPGQIFPSRKKGTATQPGGKLKSMLPSDEETMSNSKRFLKSSTPTLPPGSSRSEWKSLTLPRDIQSSHFDSGTFGGKPALPRKKGDSVLRGGALTPPPRLPKKNEDPSEEASESSALTPKVSCRPQNESSKNNSLQSELFKPNVLPPLRDETRPRRLKTSSEVPSQREREKAKFGKPKPAPPPPPVSNVKSGNPSRSPTFELQSEPKTKTPELNPMQSLTNPR